MRALDRKMLRDLLGMWGQVMAIALVIVAGVSTYVAMTSVMDALTRTLADYYRDYHFAEGFASVRRAPEPVRAAVTFGRPQSPDMRLARECARTAGIEHRQCVLTMQNWWEGREAAIWQTDGLVSVHHLHAAIAQLMGEVGHQFLIDEIEHGVARFDQDHRQRR